MESLSNSKAMGTLLSSINLVKLSTENSPVNSTLFSSKVLNNKTFPEVVFSAAATAESITWAKVAFSETAA